MNAVQQLIQIMAAGATDGGAELPGIFEQMTRSIGLLALAVLVLAVKAGFVAMALWYATTCPRSADRMLQFYQTQGRRCIVLGIVNLVVVLILISVLVATHILGILGILLFIALLAFVVAGYGAAYRSLGVRIRPESDAVQAVLRGGIAAECAFLMPVLGQLLSLGMLLRGLGAAVLTALSARKPEEQPPEA